MERLGLSGARTVRGWQTQWPVVFSGCRRWSGGDSLYWVCPWGARAAACGPSPRSAGQGGHGREGEGLSVGEFLGKCKGECRNVGM